ncbi:MAG: hypothetical protein NTV34_01075 [Proteobacteria bacterium]|nr:hypothetical protein [Pseudomonadota bacterium]
MYINILVFLIMFGVSAYGAEMTKSAAPDTGNKIGVGVGFSGAPGVSVYVDTGYKNFLQGGVGFAPLGSYAATGDYAFGYRNAVSSLPSLTHYWGLGAVVLHDQTNQWPRYAREEDTSTTYVGARIPLGLNFVIPKTPVQLGAELAPSLLLTPATYSYLQGGLSARVLF